MGDIDRLSALIGDIYNVSFGRKIWPSVLEKICGYCRVKVAPVLGISEATVKTHLQRIFAKTETGRQADLVKLVASYMSPLAPSQS